MVSAGDKAISLHTQVAFMGRGGGVLWANSNPKSLNLAKFSFGGYSGPTKFQGPSIWPSFHWERGVTLDQLKPEVPTSLTIFIFTLDTTFLKYLSEALKEF